MKRAVLCGSIAIALLVGGAQAADSLSLTLVSQTSTTITLGWTPQRGYGYLFSADGNLVSRTNDPNRSTARFSKSYSTYEVAVIVKGLMGTYPPPVPPPPPPPSGTAPWLGSFDASYRAAPPGSTVVVPAGTYSGQVIQYRVDVANLAGGCAPADTSRCVRFVMGGPVTLNGPLEIRGSGVWVQGGGQLRVNGYIDTEANSVAQHPDHVIVEGTSSPSFGVFNADTVTFRDMNVGPATVANSGCGIAEGAGLENKIGFGGGVTYVPRNITLERLRVHDQNGNANRGDCHWGGFFLVTVDGLTIRDSVFERNVVYHIQIQNFGGAPAAKNVLIDHNSFSCPVNWLYQGAGCDGQRAVQFDYDPGSEFTLSNNVAANGANGLYGCYVGSCGGLVGVRDVNNTNLPESTTAPPLR